MKACLVLAAGWFLAGNPLLAGPLLPEVTVFGEGAQLPESSDVTVLEGKQLGASGARTLSDALARGVPGLSVEKRGGREGSGGIIIRGISADRIQLRVDGVPRDAASLDSIPIMDVRRVEILRGAASARYGDRAMGGVILVTTRQGRQEDLSIAAGLASFGTTIFRLRVPLAWTNGRVRISFARDESGGGWLFPGQLTEKPDGSTRLDGSPVRALNTGYLDWRLRISGEVLGLTFSGEYLERDAGVPGTIDFPTIRAAMRDRTLAGRVLSSASSLLAEGDEVSVTVSASTRQRQYRDFALYAREDRYDLGQAGVSAIWSIANGQGFELRAGLEGQTASLDALVAGGTDTTGRRTRSSLAIYSDVGYRGEDWSINAALRAEGTGGFASRLSPAMGASLQLARGVRLSANAGTAWRIPSLDDLFWPATAFAVGNDALRPESSASVDAGIRLDSLDGLSATVTGFVQRSRDLVLWQPSAGGVWRPGNIGEVSARGVEAVLEWIHPLGEMWQVECQAEYSLQVNRVCSGDSTDGSQLPRTPHEKGSGGVVLRQTRLGMLRLGARYTGFRYLNMANTKYLGDHLLLDLAIELRFCPWSVLRGSIENLLDTPAVHLREYPVPGREWSFSLEVKL